MRVSTILSLLSLLLTLSFSLYTEVPFSAGEGAIGEGFALYKKGDVVYLISFADLKGKAIGTGLFWAGDRAYVVDGNALSVYSAEGKALETHTLPASPESVVVLYPYVYATTETTAYVWKLGNQTEEMASWPSRGRFIPFGESVAYVEGLDTTVALDPDFNRSQRLGYPVAFANPPYVVDGAGFLHILRDWKEVQVLSGPFSAAGGGWAVGSNMAYRLEDGKEYPTRGVAYFAYESWKGFDVFASPNTLLFLKDKPLVEKVLEEGAVLDVKTWQDKLYVLTTEGLWVYDRVEGCYLPLEGSMPTGTYEVEASFYPDGRVAINTGEGWVRTRKVKLTVSSPVKVECRLVEPRKEQRPWEVVRVFPLSWSGQGVIKILQRPTEVKAGQRVRLYFYDARTNVPLEDVTVSIAGEEKVVDEYLDVIINEPGRYEVVVEKEGYLPATHTLEVEGMSPVVLIVGILGGLLLVGAGIYYYIVYVRS